MLPVRILTDNDVKRILDIVSLSTRDNEILEVKVGGRASNQIETEVEI